MPRVGWVLLVHLAAQRCVVEHRLNVINISIYKSHYAPVLHLKLNRVLIKIFGGADKMCYGFFYSSKFWPTYQSADKILSARAGPANNGSKYIEIN